MTSPTLRSAERPPFNRRHLHTAPATEDVLRAEITEVCAQIDRRHANPPGTAERAAYFWLWPGDTLDAATLAALHADAVGWLHQLVTTDRKDTTA